MNLLTIITVGFLAMETANVATLYFSPESKFGNGIGVFKAWEKSKADPEVHSLMKYLVNWIAGTKLIFIALLVSILHVADNHTMLVVGVALVFSIASFFWRLFPQICELDQEGQIEPHGYSKVLGWMIGSLLLTISIAIVVTVIQY